MLINGRIVPLGGSITKLRTCFQSATVTNVPPEIYYAYIQEGIGKIARCYTDARDQIEMVKILEDVIAIDIAFEGEWILTNEQEYQFLSLEVPSVAYVLPNKNLMYRPTINIAPILVATGVTACAIQRGWKSVVDAQADQGMVIVYSTPDGVFMKRYDVNTNRFAALQQISTTPAESLNVSRTLDYRMAIIANAQSVETIYVTSRNWVGLAGASESLNSGVSAAIITPRPVESIFNTFDEQDTIITNVTGMAVGKPNIQPTLLFAWNELNEVTCIFDQPMVLNTAILVEAGISVRDSTGAFFFPVLQIIDDWTWKLDIENFNNAEGTVTITVKDVGYFTKAGSVGLSVQKTFTPIGLTPDDTTPPAVLQIYN